ncbi:hypothetical protein Aspvir_003291 [Aspergillus viridinutans]|uniref:Uncharacterized protein n=1 Tax=Aspergillus viridinutans TaxID=75553 RepID=A0A9P3C2J8_ASPVI|nr:uncharacterized protein Aspvir_003291 [Aspergillus viridinutans]GIK07625.1 hypothetical protein Aspvir_003291 [Aspergillus viridinutans]
MSTAVQGYLASMHAPQGASCSGGRRPDRGNGGQRPPDRGPGKVMKKKKEACRIYGGLLVAQVLATESSRLPVRAHRHPLGPQKGPRMDGPN